MHDLNRRAPMSARERADLCPNKLISSPGGDVSFHFDRAFTLAEVSERLGISLRQVQAHIDDGNLVAVNVGRGRDRRDLRILDEDLEGFARRRKTGVSTAAFVPPKAAPHRKADPEPVGYAARRAARLAAKRGLSEN
ncbi:helix-turn-helix domain-containing protein [Methylobacterium sp. V23]|uniref:helix-turn-helix domain-containing protein n=1 Tax=Methylobacterium sp. V23 TaxID=2044878 RepID=UPI000CDAEF8B|nr:helix-turn-helix domain-containing protein [Methylobacterium sp. V23]POR42371.1 hypothetical protein CRT23_12935 [Methylobacterium sp. V23]